MRLLPFEYAARNAGRKPVITLLTILGAAAVVFLVILMGSFVQTLGSTMRDSGDPRNVIVLGAGSEDYMEQSQIGSAVPSVLAASVPQIARYHGEPMISPEIYHAALARAGDGSGAQRMAVARGITPAAFLVHQQVFVREGRVPGSGEMLVGSLAATKMGLAQSVIGVGDEIEFEGKTWKVSGIFDAPGTSFESELWVPLEELKLQTKRAGITCAVVRLKSAGESYAIDVYAKTRLDLEIAAVNEARYYSRLAAFFRPMQILGWVMAALIVVSGLFAGLNTVIAAITARAREFGCLETLGFSRMAIFVSLLHESVLQTAAGALLASAMAMLVLQDRAVRISMAALSLDVTPPVLTAGLASALFLALVGTVIPSITLARTPMTDLLKS